MRLPALASLSRSSGPALAAPATAADLTGRWRAASGNVEVEIAPCGAALCGTIVRVLVEQVDGRSHRRDARACPGSAWSCCRTSCPRATAASRASSTTARAARPTAAPCRSSRPTGSRCIRTWASRCSARPRSGPASPATARRRAYDDFGPAPEFAGIERWLNSEPLMLSELRGKVVLVDFWTAACGNCIAALPHVTKWYDSYAAQGLVVVGVHTPESPYEALPETVEKAVARWKIRYPVARGQRLRDLEGVREPLLARGLPDRRARPDRPAPLRRGHVRRDRDRDPPSCCAKRSAAPGASSGAE